MAEPTAVRHCDLILENGRYHLNVEWEEREDVTRWQGRRVVHLLPLRGLYRMPLLGPLLRNHWAKRHGAIL